MGKTLIIDQPDDWHLHLREGDCMRSIVQDTARIFARAIIMPNLPQPVTRVEQAEQYRIQIQHALPPESEFNPLMTLYLTDNTSVKEIQKVAESPHLHAVKLYPAGATTNSDAGITSLDNCYPVLEMMQKSSIPLLIHGEVTSDKIDIFDREKIFLDQVLTPLISRFPDLKIVLEHITTGDAVQFIRNSPENVGATITAHHLLINRNHLLVGGIKPHNFCLPVVKREEHRIALLEAATSGSNKFFLGTDSAPHAQSAKENACGCAGIYTAHQAIPFYAEAFDSVGKLEKLEYFSSHSGADFYGLPRNSRKITLQKEEQLIPETIPYGEEQLVPFRSGQMINWSAHPDKKT
ncbi:MAG: dihydroorotase [Proteobacteria bacterium]|nr:dihydroorotase [Pseudomonadota bacterium]